MLAKIFLLRFIYNKGVFMHIDYNMKSPSFQAKFLYSDTLKDVVSYAKREGRYKELNNARLKIEDSHLRTRLKVEIGADTKGFPTVTFTRYIPKPHVIIPVTENDYIKSRPMVYHANIKISPLQYAYDKIIKLANSAPNGSMFTNIVKRGKI